MSGTTVRLMFSVVIDDPDRWTDEHKQQGNSDPDWVVAQIHEAMSKAGDDYIKGHPDLFRGTEVI